MMKKHHITAYVIGVPVVSVLFYSAHQALIWHAVAIGDTANGTVTLPHGIALAVMNFPMMCIYAPLGDRLEPLLTDNGVLRLFSAINALLWGLGTVSLAIWRRKRVVEQAAAHVPS